MPELLKEEEDPEKTNKVKRPKLDEIKQLRENRDAWLWMMTNFLTCAEPEMKKKVKHEPMHQWCTIAVEAVVHVIVENNYELWEDEHKKAKDENHVLSKVAQCTNNAKSGAKYAGWNDKGIDRYNDIHDAINKARKVTTHSETLANLLKSKCAELDEKKKNPVVRVTKKPRVELPPGWSRS
jgi:hypothetical protein